MNTIHSDFPSMKLYLRHGPLWSGDAICTWFSMRAEQKSCLFIIFLNCLHISVLVSLFKHFYISIIVSLFVRLLVRKWFHGSQDMSISFWPSVVTSQKEFRCQQRHPQPKLQSSWQIFPTVCSNSSTTAVEVQWFILAIFCCQHWLYCAIYTAPILIVINWMSYVIIIYSIQLFFFFLWFILTRGWVKK